MMYVYGLVMPAACGRAPLDGAMRGCMGGCFYSDIIDMAYQKQAEGFIHCARYMEHACVLPVTNISRATCRQKDCSTPVHVQLVAARAIGRVDLQWFMPLSCAMHGFWRHAHLLVCAEVLTPSPSRADGYGHGILVALPFVLERLTLVSCASIPGRIARLLSIGGPICKYPGPTY